MKQLNLFNNEESFEEWYQRIMRENQTCPKCGKPNIAEYIFGDNPKIKLHCLGSNCTFKKTEIYSN